MCRAEFMGITWQLPAYTRLRFALVGAGGGIPDLRKGLDIRPGDVVISQPDQTYGGVVHCNLVKNVGDDHKGYSRLGAILSTSTLCIRYGWDDPKRNRTNQNLGF